MQITLITGGAQRIGAKIVRLLALKGCQVIIHFNKSEVEAKKLAAQFNCKAIQADFSNPDGVHKLLYQIPKIDVLINNAAAFGMDTPECCEEQLKLYSQINYQTPKQLIEGYIKTNPSLIAINLLDAWAETKPEKFRAYYESKIELRKFIENSSQLFPTAKIFGIHLGATMYKKGQNINVFKHISSMKSSNVESLLRCIDCMLDSSSGIISPIIDLTL